MDYFDNLQSNGSSTPQSSGGGYFDSLISAPSNQNKIDQYNADAKTAQQESDKQNSMWGKVTGFFSGVADASAEKIAQPTWDAVKNTWDTYNKFPQKFMDDVNAGADDLAQGQAKGGVGGLGQVFKGIAKSGIRTAGDFAQAIFAPISSAIGAALQKTGGQQLQDNLGKIIADGSGITDMPAFQNFAMQHPNFAEDFNRIVMLGMSGGEKGDIDPKRMIQDVQNLAKRTVEQAKPINVPVTSETPGETKVPVNTPQSKYQAYLKDQGYEPYTPADKLPTIDAGKPLKDTLPTVQVGESIRVTKNTKGDFVYEPIKDATQAPPPPPEVLQSDSQTNKSQPSKSSSQPASDRPTLTDGTRVTKSASDINDIIQKQGYQTLSPQQQARYEPGSYNDDLVKVKEMVDTDPEKAKAMATGSIPIEGVKYPEILFNEVERKATAEGDIDTLKALANSPVSKTSEAGATLGSHGFNDNPNSAVDAMNEVKKAREGFVEKNKGKGVAEDTSKSVENTMNEEAKKSTSKTWEDFKSKIIDSLTCKI